MGELKDYQGEFVPALRYEDMSKDVLIKLLRETSRTLGWVGAYWYSIIGDKYGVDEADFQSLDVWIKEADFCIPRVAEALGIKPTDVASAMKFWQVDPAFSSQLFKYNIDIVARDHAVLTITHCPSLVYQEREGKGKEKFTCQVLEPLVIVRYFGALGLEWVEVRPLKVPPRRGWEAKGWGGIACQWDFKAIPEKEYKGKIADTREGQLRQVIDCSWKIQELENAIAAGKRRYDSELENLHLERRMLLRELKWKRSRNP